MILGAGPSDRAVDWFYTHNLDFNGADILESEILTVNIGDLLGQVPLDGVELGVGADFQPQLRVEQLALSRDGCAGGCDAADLFATGFDHPMQSVPRNLEPSVVVFREYERPGPL